MLTKAVVLFAAAVTTYCLARTAQPSPSERNRPGNPAAVEQTETTGKVDLHAFLSSFKSARRDLSNSVATGTQN